MDMKVKQSLEAVALSIRSLSMDAIQKANSGHPGLPLGCAEIGSVLYGRVLQYHHKDLAWPNRDRFVLSAGHGSMLLYSLLHLSDCGMSMEDIKSFRQLGSTTPGHPENFISGGVETTTGPLGQGLGAAVGMALAGKILAQKFNTPKHTIFDYSVYVLAGDGCIMEGLSSEVSSFAAHNQLDNLVVLYDSNDICLDGDLSECFSEDVPKRFEAFGFEHITIDGHNLEELEKAFLWAKNKNSKPKLIICKTQIGKGSPNRAGTSSVHGSPLGMEELNLTKQTLGIPENEEFYIAPGTREFFEEVNRKNSVSYDQWYENFSMWKEENPHLSQVLDQMKNPDFQSLEDKLPRFEPNTQLAGRKSSQECIQVIAKEIPSFIGGSADLSCSDSTTIKTDGMLTPEDFSQRNIKFGVRELGMSGICSGLALSEFFTPYCGTFLTFSDYLRPSLRLSSLMGLKVTYQFTHDSIFLGEDGPTHQPVEHAAALRTIPGCYVFRPADGNEVRSSWVSALNCDGPRALLLSRQNLPHLEETNRSASEGVGRGAYIALPADLSKGIDRVIYASGSELHLAIEVGKELRKREENVTVVSVPCFELFEMQSRDYKNEILLPHVEKRYAIEAMVPFGWHRFTGLSGLNLCVDRFGKSAPYQDLAEDFGFTVSSLIKRILDSDSSQKEG